jgi:hypothetical protein
MTPLESTELSPSCKPGNASSNSAAQQRIITLFESAFHGRKVTRDDEAYNFGIEQDFPGCVILGKVEAAKTGLPRVVFCEPTGRVGLYVEGQLDYVQLADHFDFATANVTFDRTTTTPILKRTALEGQRERCLQFACTFPLLLWSNFFAYPV